MVKKHVKPNPMKGTTGGVVDKTMPIHQSNVAIFNAKTGKADRVGFKMLDATRKTSKRARVQVQRRRDQGLRGDMASKDKAASKDKGNKARQGPQVRTEERTQGKEGARTRAQPRPRRNQGSGPRACRPSTARRWCPI